MKHALVACAAIACLSLGVGSAPASAQTGAISANLFKNLSYRNIGPATTGGRFMEVVGVPGDPRIVVGASASGGVWKTEDGGATWTPIFDSQDVMSIGSVAIQPGDPEVIWVGTGEGNARNTISFGDGIYKTTDGGKTWQHLGLEDSEHIDRIAINPKNPDNVYAATMGHLYGPNTERGLYVTWDGGKTWQKSLYIDENHAAADVSLDPTNPNVVYATMWYVRRLAWTFTSGDDKSGVYKSVDAGKTWTKLTTGLPREVGRSGVQVAPSNPNVVYVIAESNEGTVFRSDDAGAHFRMMTDNVNALGRGTYYARLTVDPVDENRIYTIGMTLSDSEDGGRTLVPIASGIHGDHHTVWVDPMNDNRVWQGCDGGLAVSYDRGRTWIDVDNIPVTQLYTVHTDDREPFYWVSYGLQDNGTWTGPSRTRDSAGIRNYDWVSLSGGDGFYAVNDPTNPDDYLADSQGGNLTFRDIADGQSVETSPQPRRNDGSPVGELKYRFNWDTPIVISPHDPHTVYFGGNVVFKSTDFGRNWQVISPDLTSNDPKQEGQAGGPVWTENTTAEYYNTILTISESPAKAGIIWAGTDDCHLQVTSNDGQSWSDVIANIPGNKAGACEVQRVETSRTDANTAWIAVDRHEWDDFHPYFYKTTDMGKTWTNITGNLPARGYSWVLRQDPVNPNLLYAGTELGLYASWTGGNEWIPLKLSNMPAVAVRDIAVQPREDDLVVASHGRGAWILDDVHMLQEMTPEVAAANAALFDMRPATRFAPTSEGYSPGQQKWAGPNPPAGAEITYYLKSAATGVRLQILDKSGQAIATVPATNQAGINRVVWNLQIPGPRPRGAEAGGGRGGRGGRGGEVILVPGAAEPAAGGGGGGGGRGGAGGITVLPGTYTVRLIVAGQNYDKPLTVRMDPTLKVTQADLETAYNTELHLRDMAGTVNDVLRDLDGVRLQLANTQQTVATMVPTATDVRRQVTENLQQLDTLMEKYVNPPATRPYSKGPKLGNRISGLMSQIDRANAAPTQADIAYMNELEKEIPSCINDVNAWMRDSLGKLNTSLAQVGMPPIWAGKPLNATAAPAPSSSGNRR